MPSANSLWLVSAPSSDRPTEQLQVVLHPDGRSVGEFQQLKFPPFNTGTLSDLLTLSDACAKADPSISATLLKTIDSLQSLDPGPLRVNGQPYLDTIYSAGGDDGWNWNRGKYTIDTRSLREVVDQLVKEAQSIEASQRVKSAAYSILKSQLAAANRKNTGNLSVRSLAEVVKPETFKDTTDSEYLDTLLVAVPKNLAKEWNTSYERLTSMVVPRSSAVVSTDDEFTLFSVVVFRKVKEDFAQKCRENKFIVRDFTFNVDLLEKQEAELAKLITAEKEARDELKQLSQINFEEIVQVLVHFRVVRAFVESVLRYGLPADYFFCVIKPNPKQLPKLIQVLTEHFAALSPSAKKVKKLNKKGEEEDGPIGEFSGVLEGEYLDFVCFEVERHD